MSKIKVKSLVSLTIPIFLELLLITIVGNIDTIMLNHYSDKAVGAVGGISQVLNIQNVIFGFINLATSILCAQFIGARNKKKVQEVITVSLIVNLLLGLLMGALYFGFWELILQKINLPLELVDIGKTYFKLVGGLCVFQAITLTCGAIMKSHGNPKPMLYVNMGVNVLNIFGNGMFIFGWFGMPVLGATGVGISTVVSRFIGCIVGFLVMSKYCHFKFRKKFLKPFPFHIVKNILSIGIPTAGENFAWNVGQLMIMAMVNKMGPTMITSRTYLMLIANFVMTFSISLGHATAIQVGQLVGAREDDEAYRRCINSLKISILLAIVVTGTVVIFKRPIMEVFTKDEAILAASLVVFPFMFVLEVGRVFNIVIINSLHAAGDIKYPMAVGVGFVFLVAVLFSYILGIKFEMGLVGIWIANAADEWFRGIAMWFRWKSKKWKNKRFI